MKAYKAVFKVNDEIKDYIVISSSISEAETLVKGQFPEADVIEIILLSENVISK